ncbi:MAG: ribulokinase [Phycisphaeraceae bacterium]|nr:MAG: ribulokinase [Phycisphaeraceae bacterium]
MSERVFLGLDFGTESVRAVVVDRSGRTLGSAVEAYTHGSIVPGSASAARLFPGGLPAGYALQHPGDWLASSATASRRAIGLARQQGPGVTVGGIGVDFTSCTMLPCRRDGTPLCEDATLAGDPHAWPKLWKHHGAVEQTARLNAAARGRREPWLARYGGVIGLEWLFPKMLEAVEASGAVLGHADLWIEAGDWVVWRLIGGGEDRLVRSTCQAGYKALWSPEEGYPSSAYLASVSPGLAETVRRGLWGTHRPPGVPAGGLGRTFSALSGVPEGVPVSVAVIDAHAGVPGAGVAEPGTLVMVLGTSGCHMLMSEHERRIPGVAGVVKDGILPGWYGYETGQAAMGDAFDGVRRLTGSGSFERLVEAAESAGPGAGGVVALDWFNGCRTPLMDGSLTGAFAGLRLDHGPGHLFRATMDASAMSLRWIVETLRDGGVPVERFVATGGLPRHNPLFIKIIASVLEAEVQVHPAEHGPALGAAILGALAAGDEGGGFSKAEDAVRSMAGEGSAAGRPSRITPDAAWSTEYERAYRQFRQFAAQRSGTV